ncbi:MAG: phage holin family protein [Clostridia bacterium]
MEKILTLIVTMLFKVMIVTIVLDCILGVLRAIKERKFNSCIGIDGLVRKFAMLVTAIGTKVIDNIVQFNFIGFVPQTIRDFIHLDYAGISDLFLLLFIAFEALSILKNLTRLKLPFFKGVQAKLEEFLEKYTDETIKVDKEV